MQKSARLNCSPWVCWRPAPQRLAFCSRPSNASVHTWGAPQPCGWPLPRSAGILLAALGALASVPGTEHPATARTPPVAGHSSATARPRETPSLGREKRRRFLENLGLLKNMKATPRSEHFATPDKLHRTARPDRLMQCVIRTLAQNCFYMLCVVVVSRPSTG